MKSSFRLSLAAALGAAAFVACAKPPAPAPETKSMPASEKPAAEGGLYARLVTNRGEILIRLLPDEAPKTVENFVGLATGKKQWKDPASGQPTNRRLYDGTRFFRVIPGFMIQGGDPLNEGVGGPGYRFEDEFHPGRAFDRAGLLAMANSGPNTNGSQFFITLGAVPWLNNRHTIFGEVVEGLEVAESIAAAARTVSDPKTGRQIDRPNEPQVVKKVVIEER